MITQQTKKQTNSCKLNARSSSVDSRKKHYPTEDDQELEMISHIAQEQEYHNTSWIDQHMTIQSPDLWRVDRITKKLENIWKSDQNHHK
jgi:hypothetical protein